MPIVVDDKGNVKRDYTNTEISVSSTGNVEYVPIKKANTSSKKKKKGIFDAFDDGYDFGDVTKTILGAGKDAAYIGKNFIGGMLSGGSGIITSETSEIKNSIEKSKKESTAKNIIDLFDTAMDVANPAKAVRKYLSNTAENVYDNVTDDKKTTKQKLGSIATKQVTLGKNMINPTSPVAQKTIQLEANLIGKKNADKVYNAVDKVENAVNEPARKYNEKLQEEAGNYGVVTQKLGEAANVVGNMAPSVATSVVTKNPNLGLQVMGASAKGNAIKEALAQGADLDQAIDIGNTKGAIEIGTEMLSGGVNVFGKGAIDDIVERKINEKVKNKVVNYLVKRGIVDNVGEIAEETISDVLGTLVDQGTVNPNAKYSIKDWNDTAVTTVLSTLALNMLTGGYGKNSYRQNAAAIEQQTLKDKGILPSVDKAENGVVNKTTNNQVDNNIENSYNQDNKGRLYEDNESIQKEGQSEIENNRNMGRNRVDGRGILETGIPTESKTQETISERTHTSEGYKQFEQKAKTNQTQQLTNEQQELKNSTKAKSNKDIVFFDGKLNYDGGASLNDANTIYIPSRLNIDDQKFTVNHEIIESEIRHNKDFKENYANDVINEIISDPNFKQVRNDFIGNDKSLKNISDYMIAKDVLSDIYAEKETGINKGYNTNFSPETNEFIEYVIGRLNENLNNSKNNIPIREDVNKKVNIPTKENINNKNENAELPFEIDENELPFETTPKTNKVNTKSLDDRTINKITNNLKDELGLDKYQRNEMKKVLSEISSRDNISKAEIEKEIINRFAEKTLKIRQDEIAQIQKELKNTKVKVSDNIKLDIADYSDFRQKNYGKIGFSKEGQGVDQVYERLSKEHPEFFPRDILAPSDQLQEMAYVANLDKYVTETSILDNERIKNATDWIYDSIEDYNLQQQVRNGEISYDDYKEQSKIGKLKKTRKIVQDELGKEMGITLEDLDVGKDISSIGYQRTDPIRVNEKVFGAEVGQKINDATINRTKHNEAERTRFLNKERAEIKDLGIKARSAESAAVQKYGEKQYVDDKGVIHKYGDAELAAEFPNVETQDKIKEAAKVLREKYDTYLEDINKVITEMGYDPIPKRPDYMRHFQEINDKLSQWGIPLNPSDMSKDTLPTDINGVTDQFKPGKNWFASAMQRKGFKTTYDAITGIDGYLEGASNLMYHTGDIQRYRTLSKMIREAYGQQHGMDNLDVSTKEGQQRLNDIMDNKLSKYAAWLDEQANALAGKKGGIDRAAERLLGRKIYTVLDTAKKQVGSNMTGFNVRSALTNFASAVQGASKTKKTAFIKGTISTFKNMVHNDGLINKSDFLTNRFGSDQLSKKLWQKASNAGQIFMTGSDYFTANQIWRSKYFENLSKGMNETQAIKNADDFASRIMGDRSKGSTAEIFNSKTLGLLTQFQLEVNNQWSSIVHDNKMDLQKGNKSGATVVFQLGELAAASYFFNNLMKSLTGSDVMIDPIDMLMKMLGADDDDKDKSVGDRATEVVGDLIDDLPFASIMTGGRIPMSEAFKGGGTAFKKLSGQKDQYGNDISWKDVGGDLIESGAYWLLPTGYGQLKKTKNGLSMYDEDLPMPGSYTKSGNLRFRADESAEGKIKAALFGQYSSEEARKYMESGYKTVDKRKLGELQELNFPTSKYLEYKQELSDAGRSRIAKLDYLESTDKYTDREKNIMYKSILNLKDDEINRMNELMDVEEQNEYMYVKTQANAIKRDEDLTATEKKEQIVDLILDTDFDDEALAYLYSKFYTKEEKLQNILNADIPMKEYIKFDSQDFDGEFDESKGKTKTNSKKYEMMRYIEGLNLSAVQKALLTKSKYSSFKAYDKQIEQYIQDRSISLLDKYKLVKYAGFKSRDKEIANYVAGLNKTADEKEKLYKEMGFTTHNGRVYYK